MAKLGRIWKKLTKIGRFSRILQNLAEFGRIWQAGGMEKEKKQKTPHICESIGHRPLWGCCPKRLIKQLGRGSYTIDAKALYG